MNFRSAPAEKAPPAPVRTTALTASSCSIWSRAASSSRSTSWSRAFMASGRFRVSLATPSFFSSRILVKGISLLSLCHWLFLNDHLPGHPLPDALSGQVGELGQGQVDHAPLVG